jgi:hypothetical protein
MHFSIGLCHFIFLDPDIFLSSLLSDTLFSLHFHTTLQLAPLCCVLIFTFLYSRWQNKIFPKFLNFATILRICYLFLYEYFFLQSVTF